MDITATLRKNKIIPVAVFDSADEAVTVAELLYAHSFDIIEITLRTPAAYECIVAVKKKIPGMTVGAGSVLTVEALKAVFDIGAVFSVAPCYDPELAACAQSLGMLFIPGIATPSELAQALKMSGIVKIFPAEPLGGPAYISAVTAPFALKKFSVIPTGGINETNYRRYLKTPPVIACGMTCLADAGLIGRKDFTALEKRIKKISAELSRA